MCVSDNENTSFAFACLRVMVATKEEFQALSGAGGTGAVALPHTVKDIRFPMRWVCDLVALPSRHTHRRIDRLSSAVCSDAMLSSAVRQRPTADGRRPTAGAF